MSWSPGWWSRCRDTGEGCQGNGGQCPSNDSREGPCFPERSSVLLVLHLHRLQGGKLCKWSRFWCSNLYKDRKPRPGMKSIRVESRRSYWTLVIKLLLNITRTVSSAQTSFPHFLKKLLDSAIAVPLCGATTGSEICHQNAYRWAESTDLGADPKTCGGISAPTGAAAARKQKPGGFLLTAALPCEPVAAYCRAVDGWGSDSVITITRSPPQRPWPRSHHLGEEKVSSSSSPHSLRSTPFSFCYKYREPAAAIGPETCQSKPGPAPEVAPFFVINQLFVTFNVAAELV